MMSLRLKNICLWFLQAKYKEASKKEANSCLYHQLPETLETQHAKEATELQSQVHKHTNVFTHVQDFQKLWTVIMSQVLCCNVSWENLDSQT